MAIKDASKNAMLDALGALITHAALSDEGDELPSGGEYTRRPIVWSAASGGVLSLASAITFSVDAGAVVNRVLLRGESTIDDHTPDYGDSDVTEETFAGPGGYVISAINITIEDAV